MKVFALLSLLIASPNVADATCNGQCYAAYSTPWMIKCAPGYGHGCDTCPECDQFRTPAPTAQPVPAPTAQPVPAPTAQPVPAPTASPTALPATGACFHSNGTVLLQSGAYKPLSELIIGEFIKTYDAEGKFSFSPIKTLPHANNDEPAAFLTLKTETGKEVDMTSDHYIPNCDLTVVTVGELVVGDCLLTADGKETLMEISWTEKYGVYTAVTENKFIVVDNVVASSFSKDSHPEEPELDYEKYRMELERIKLQKRLLGRKSN